MPSPQPKAVVLCSGGPASATLCFLLGKKEGWFPSGSAAQSPSALRLALGLAPEGYDLHLLAIQDGQRPYKQELSAIRLVAGLLGASFEVLNPAALTPLPSILRSASHARLFTLAAVVAVRQGAMLVAAGMYSPYSAEESAAFVVRFNQAAQRGSTVPFFSPLRLMIPLAEFSLADLLALGQQLGGRWHTRGPVLKALRFRVAVAEIA
ncbi:MAG TPA: hypothetical protein VKT82_25015 [Ktedonobacterales bacterium]|nr:hypothetical protein [Ktedonobacterales bacterium]